LTQHFIALTSPARLLAKIAFASSSGASGDVLLVLPRVPDEEIGRVHRLVTAARKALSTASIDFQVIDIEEAIRIAASGDPSRTLVVDLDIMRGENADLLCQPVTPVRALSPTSSGKITSRTSAAIFARADSNSALAGTVLRHLTEAGIVDKRVLSTSLLQHSPWPSMIASSKRTVR